MESIRYILVGEWINKLRYMKRQNIIKCRKEMSCQSIKRYAAAAAAESLQLCPTLCDPIDGSPPGSPDPGILQARTLEWVSISFPNAWQWKVKVKSLSHVRLLATPWSAAYQAPLSMGFSRQEYWRGVPLPSPIKRCTGYLHTFYSKKLILKDHKVYHSKYTTFWKDKTMEDNFFKKWLPVLGRKRGK